MIFSRYLEFFLNSMTTACFLKLEQLPEKSNLLEPKIWYNPESIFFKNFLDDMIHEP